MALIYNASFNSGTRVLSLLDKAGNVISSCEVPSKSKELTLTATADNSSVKLNKTGTLSNTFEVNTGSGWQSYTFGTVINLNNGDSCKWRCSAHPTTQSTSNYVKFVMTGTIEASGNCNSMLSSDFENITSLSEHNYAFCYLFQGCTSLAKAPELPATTLATYCYYVMFNGCTALTKAPDLPATTLANYCYYQMFYGCSALTEVRIAATTTVSSALNNWLNNVSATGDFYCDPNATIFPSDSTSGIPANWSRWLYGAEDTETTTTMYHNGSPETVKVGTSNYGACYSAQGWAGFKLLSEMHALGYTLGAQTAITMYYYIDPVSAYSCAANNDDVFTETMYDVGDGKGYLTIAQQNAKGYYLVSTEFDGLILTATADNSSVALTKNGTLSNTYEVNMGDGSGWHSYTLGNTINLNNGDKCRWRCSNYPTTQSSSNFVQFVMTGTIEATGDSLSMLSSDFRSLTSVSLYGLYKLFMSCTSLTKAPAIPNRVSSSSDHAFASMFENCTGLSDISDIQWVRVTTYGAYRMFYGCTSIVDTSNMSCIGSTSGNSTADACCLQSMFEGCTSLVYPPSSVSVSHKPADSSLNMRARHAARMFYGCTSLCRLPTLYVSRVHYAYESMFEGCTSLTEITVPVSGVYYAYYTRYSTRQHSAYIKGVFKRMFAGCTGLKYVVWTPQDLTSSELYMEMFSGCTSLKEIYNFGWLTTSLTTYRSDTTANTEYERRYANSGTSQYTRMFENCSSLVSIDGFVISYNGEPLTEMFKGCTSLQYPPQIILGTTSVTSGGTVTFTPPSNMFLGCTSVKEVCFRKFTRTYSSIAYSDPTTMDNWLPDVSNSGVIYSSILNNIPTDSADGVPLGWELTDKSGDPLEFIALEDDSSIALNLNTAQPYSDDTYNYEYSRDGIAWQSYTLGDVLSANTGDSIFFRCDNIPQTAYFTTPTGLFDGRGNPTLNNSIFATASRALNQTVTSPTYYRGLFEGTNLRSFYSDAYLASSYLFFTRMFKDCTSLTSVGGRTFIVRNVTYPSEYSTSTAAYAQMYRGCTALTSVPYLACSSRYSRLYYNLFYGCSNLSEIRTLYTDAYSFKVSSSWFYTAAEWVEGVPATGNFYCNPEAPKTRGTNYIPFGWVIWVYGAEDTGNTATMYHNGSAETVRVGTSAWGVCCSAQGWAGFKTLAEMHTLGYTFGAQTPLTMYMYDSPVFAYSVAANIEDGFTEAMYDVGDGKGYLTIAQQNVNGYYLTSTPYTGLTLTATANNSSVKLNKVGTLSNTFEVNVGSGWTAYTFGTVINLNSGESCKWRCSAHSTTQSGSNYVQFVMTGTIEASGNCNSLLKNNFESITAVSSYDCFSLFRNCTALTKAPELPATALATYCYSNTFYGCTALTEVRIAATTMASNALQNWLSNVAASGTVYADPSFTGLPTDSASGVPQNWTREDIANYPNP